MATPREAPARRDLRALTTTVLVVCLLPAAGCGTDAGATEDASPPPVTTATIETQTATSETATSETPSQAPTKTVAPSPPPTPPLSAARGAVAERLVAAGFRTVPQAIPQGTPAVRSSYAVPTGPVVVYVVDFAAVAPAKAYRRSLDEQVRRSRGGLLVRRGGTTVFLGTATDAAGRSQLESRLASVVEVGPTPPPSTTAPAATTAAATTAPQAAQPPRRPRTEQQKLAAAGFRVVKQPPPADARGARSSFTTPSGPVVVYGVDFATVEEAKVYEQVLAPRVRDSGGGLLVRRVGETVYYATATDARGRQRLGTELARIVAAAEGG